MNIKFQQALITYSHLKVTVKLTYVIYKRVYEIACMSL